VHVDTIAGFALRYAASFPGRSGIVITEPRTPEEWAAVYEAAQRVFEGRVGRGVLRESFSGLFVDEYQDCTKDQHALVIAMADVVPARLVLDPMQGIFGFAGDLVTVDQDLAPEFEALPELTTPWRWHNGNRELGDWLVDVRRDLERGVPIDLAAAPIDHGAPTPQNQTATCRTVAGRDGSVVAIGQWPQDCQSIGRRLRGVFTCMEPIECPDLLSWAGRIEAATGPARAAELIRFASTCKTKVGTDLSSARDRLAAGTMASSAGSEEKRAAIAALNHVAASGELNGVLRAMNAIDRLPGYMYRRELWREMGRTIRAFGTDRHPTLPGAAWHVRDGGRQEGRRVERRTVSRTLLVKGLEFDHAILLDADRHDRMHLYVGLTRASSTLTVLSVGSTVSPAAMR
jgi:DNA helicase-2/ATP-dependent DNA helicase PcrA